MMRSPRLYPAGLLLGCLVLSVARARADSAPPQVWAFPPQQPLRVLALRGLWFNDYGTDRALARLGGARVTDCWHRPDNLRFYPSTPEALLRHHIVIIGNINAAAIGADRMNLLRDYVRHGGALLILGGNYGCADYHNTPLEEVAPATFPEKTSLVNEAVGLPLAPLPGASKTTAAPNAQPRVYWYHNVTPKPGAKTIATAGGHPLLLTGNYGAGRVALFAGTLLGDPPAGQLPFWKWDGWPLLLAEVLTWLKEPTAHSDAKQQAELRATFAQRLEAAHGKPAVEAALLRDFAGLCGDRATAVALLEAANGGMADLSAEAAAALMDGVRPWVDGGCAPVAQAMIASGLPHKAGLGLRLLGLAKADNARAILEKALESGELDNEPGEDLLAAPDTAGEMGPEQRMLAIRLAAIEGLGNLGSADAIPALRAAQKRYYVKEPPRGGESAPLVKPETMLYEEAVLAALRCGDVEAAGPAVDVLLGLRYRFFHTIVALDQPEYEFNETTKLMKKRAWEGVARQLGQEQYAVGELSGLPDAVLPALAARLATEDDPHAAMLAFSAFGNRAVSPAVAAVMRRSHVQAIADLAGK